MLGGLDRAVQDGTSLSAGIAAGNEHGGEDREQEVEDLAMRLRGSALDRRDGVG